MTFTLDSKYSLHDRQAKLAGKTENSFTVNKDGAAKAGLRIVWLPLLFIFSTIILVAATLAGSPSLNSFLIGFSCIFAILLVTIPIIAGKTETIISPLHFLSLVVFISMPLRYFTLFSYPELRYTLWYLRSDQPSDFVIGGFMTCLGLSALILGYLSTRKRIDVSPALVSSYSDINRSRLLLLCLALFPFGVLSIFMSISASGIQEISAKRGVIEGSVRYADAYLGLFVDFTQLLAALTLAYVLRFREQRSFLGLLAYLGFLIALFDAFSSQVRAEILILIVVFGTVYAVAVGKVPCPTYSWASMATISINQAVQEATDYVNFSRYDWQIDPWRKAFGPDCLLVIKFESYVADRSRALKRICEHLGLSDQKLDIDVARQLNASSGKRVAKGAWRHIIGSRLYRDHIRHRLPQVWRDRGKVILPRAPETIDEAIDDETLAFINAKLSDADRALWEKAE